MTARILFTGGGTLGSVTPLLAVAEELSRLRGDSVEMRWLGTSRGPERTMVQDAGILFASIVAGKLRRYFSPLTLFTPFVVGFGFVQSFFYMFIWRPAVIVSAGSFTAVPVVWAGWLLGVKSIVLQLDLVPGLSNKLTAQCATRIGVAFDDEVRHFEKRKTQVVGIPVRSHVRAMATISKTTRTSLLKKMDLPVRLPIVLVLGGGTGSQALNVLVESALPLLSGYFIVHVTGVGKEGASEVLAEKYAGRYRVFSFLKEELIDYMALADVVVSRAGMGTLAELSVLAKPTIVIPLPHSHQVVNARYFQKKHAVVYLEQEGLSGKRFFAEIARVMRPDYSRKLARGVAALFPMNSVKEVVGIVEEVGGFFQR